MFVFLHAIRRFVLKFKNYAFPPNYKVDDGIFQFSFPPEADFATKFLLSLLLLENNLQCGSIDLSCETFCTYNMERVKLDKINFIELICNNQH